MFSNSVGLVFFFFLLIGELYKLILPIYEKKRCYDLLRQSHERLAQNYAKVVEANKSGKRLLGRFYRVAFFGQAYFEEEAGSQYIYKEPKVTSLSEISERLHKQYCEKFGQDVVKMIKDSIPVRANTEYVTRFKKNLRFQIEQGDLDQKYAYVQVTHATPYFEKNELEDRPTEFEQNHDIATFMFETPFTKDGRTRGNPEEQWKRRTILTSNNNI